MPLYESDRPAGPGPGAAVRASIAVELEWLLLSAQRPDFRRDHRSLNALFDEQPSLLTRVQDIWGAEDETRCEGFMEILVVADQGGLLFSDDADELLGRFEELCSNVSGAAADHPMHSENDADRKAVLRRLSRLRRSPDTRRQYALLLRDVWEAVRDDWDRHGRDAVEATSAVKSGLLAKGAGWRDITRDACEFGELLEHTVAKMGPDGTVVVVPSYFAHVGLLYDVPGTVIVSVKADNAGVAARARTEALARRLRAISDPTRLAILDSLRSGPKTVTELATRFALAQPTVSNHVKLLRDTGIVSDARHGTRRNLVVRHEVVDELMAELQRVLAQGPTA